MVPGKRSSDHPILMRPETSPHTARSLSLGGKPYGYELVLPCSVALGGQGLVLECGGVHQLPPL